MKSTTKRIISFGLVFCLLFTAVFTCSVSALSLPYHDDCGDLSRWEQVQYAEGGETNAAVEALNETNNAITKTGNGAFLTPEHGKSSVQQVSGSFQVSGIIDPNWNNGLDIWAWYKENPSVTLEGEAKAYDRKYFKITYANSSLSARGCMHIYGYHDNNSAATATTVKAIWVNEFSGRLPAQTTDTIEYTLKYLSETQCSLTINVAGSSTSVTWVFDQSINRSTGLYGPDGQGGYNTKQSAQPQVDFSDGKFAFACSGTLKLDDITVYANDEEIAAQYQTDYANVLELNDTDVTLENAAQIEAAYNAYLLLTSEQQAFLTNEAAKLEALLQAADDLLVPRREDESLPLVEDFENGLSLWRSSGNVTAVTEENPVSDSRNSSENVLKPGTTPIFPHRNLFPENGTMRYVKGKIHLYTRDNGNANHDISLYPMYIDEDNYVRISIFRDKDSKYATRIYYRKDGNQGWQGQTFKNITAHNTATGKDVWLEFYINYIDNTITLTNGDASSQISFYLSYVNSNSFTIADLMPDAFNNQKFAISAGATQYVDDIEVLFNMQNSVERAIDGIQAANPYNTKSLDAAKAAYDALNDYQKKIVSNVDRLTAAEAEYEKVKNDNLELYQAFDGTNADNWNGGTINKESASENCYLTLTESSTVYAPSQDSFGGDTPLSEISFKASIKGGKGASAVNENGETVNYGVGVYSDNILSSSAKTSVIVYDYTSDTNWRGIAFFKKDGDILSYQHIDCVDGKYYKTTDDGNFDTLPYQQQGEEWKQVSVKVTQTLDNTIKLEYGADGAYAYFTNKNGTVRTALLTYAMNGKVPTRFGFRQFGTESDYDEISVKTAFTVRPQTVGATIKGNNNVGEQDLRFEINLSGIIIPEGYTVKSVGAAAAVNQNLKGEILTKDSAVAVKAELTGVAAYEALSAGKSYVSVQNTGGIKQGNSLTLKTAGVRIALRAYIVVADNNGNDYTIYTRNTSDLAENGVSVRSVIMVAKRIVASDYASYIPDTMKDSINEILNQSGATTDVQKQTLLDCVKEIYDKIQGENI